MTLAQLESRVRALEAEVEKLRAGAQAPAPAATTPARDPWWQRIHGTFENDDAFKEAMRLGREIGRGKVAKPRRRAKSRRKAK